MRFSNMDWGSRFIRGQIVQIGILQYEFKRKYSHKIEKIIFYHQNINEMKLCHQFLKNIDIAKVDVGMSIELSPKGISKASGLMKLCQILKISMNEIMAVGDSDNDLDILNQVGLAISVGNANENVKKNVTRLF